MKKIKNILVLTVLVSSLNGCFESEEDLNPDTSEVTVIGVDGLIGVDNSDDGDTDDDGADDDGADDGGAQIVESDDEPAVSPLGNDIVSVTIVKDDTNLIISQVHKAAKDPFFSNRVYLTVDESDTITTPIPGGAASLIGLVAEQGYIFEYNGEGFNISRQFVSNGIWVVDDNVTGAIATGGDTELTTMTIPLSEIGNPPDSTPIQMMFVATGNGFGTDQAPNDAMFIFTNELSTDDPIAAVAEIVESDDIPAVSPLGNDIVSIALANDGTNLVISDLRKAAKDPFFSTRVYLTIDGSDTITTPIPGGAASLTGLVAEQGFVFEFNGEGFNISSQTVSNGIWVLDDIATTAIATGGDTELITISIPLSEIGNPAVGSTIQIMVVDTGNGFATDQAPNDAMFQYVLEAPTNNQSTDDPVDEVPDTDTPDTDTPDTDTPDTDTPDTDTPVTDTPDTDTPVTDTPVTDTPDTDTPDTETPVTDVPVVDVPEIVESDDEPALTNLGNDIVSISLSNDGTNLVVSDLRKAPKVPFFSTRVYLTIDGSDTITTPIPGGAASLTGLVAEQGFVFEYNGEGFNISSQTVNNGVWVVDDIATTSIATGGDTELITMSIPLSEIGNPAVGSTIQIMVVDTGNGFETDQAPNDGMFQYVLEAP